MLFRSGNIALSSTSPLLRTVRKETEAKRLALLGLNKAEGTNLVLTAKEATANFKTSTATLTDVNAKAVAKKAYKNLSTEESKLISLKDMEVIATNNLTESTVANAAAKIEEANANKMSYISLKDGHVLKNEEILQNELFIATENSATGAIEANTFAQHLNNGTLKVWIRNLAKSTANTLKQAGATALMTAKFLLLTPEGWAVSTVIGAIAIAAYDLFKIGRAHV